MLQAPPIPALNRIWTSPASASDVVWTTLSTALDATVMRGVQLVVERALIPSQEDVQALRSSADVMLDAGLQADPHRFFAYLDDPAPDARVSTEDRWVLRAGGSAYRRVLRTDYVPPSSESDRPAAAREQAVPFEHWVHDDAPSRGTLIALHGFAMGRPSLDARALFARQWFERGLDVALVTLPEHGVRTPASARFSGECFAVPHVTRLGEAVRTAIYEIFAIKRWLRGREEAPVGLLGLSLGGYLTALAAGLSDDLDFAIPMVAPACMGDLAWRVFRGTRHYRQGGAHETGVAAFSEDEMRACFRVHSPLAHPLRVPKERVLIVAGRGDRVVPPEHPTALWEHWGEPPIHWFSGSHVAPFGRARVVDAISQHLRSLAIL